MRKQIFSFVLCMAATFGLASVSHAQFVVPSSYLLSAPGEGQAQGGGFNYFDDGGVQLTDGILGADAWSADLGNGNAHEWVGWIIAEPTATFDFGGSTSLNQVQIGFNRAEGAGIFLPSSVIINGVTNTLTGTEIPDGTRGFLNFNTTFTGSSLQVSLVDNNASRWVFTDEIRFVSAQGAAAPEPASLALIGLGIAAFGLRLGRRK